MIRVRSITGAAKYFREVDPNTCLTESAIRKLVLSGAVPCKKTGRKYFVSIEALEAYFSAEDGQNEKT